MGVTRDPRSPVAAESGKALPERRPFAPRTSGAGPADGVADRSAPQHDPARISPSAPIQRLSFSSAAGHVKKHASSYLRSKTQSFRDAASGMRNLGSKLKSDPGGALRVGMGVLGLPGWMGAHGTRGEDEGADGREVFRDQWEDHFKSLSPEAEKSARKRFRLHDKPGGGQVPGAGAVPPASSFDAAADSDSDSDSEDESDAED